MNNRLIALAVDDEEPNLRLIEEICHEVDLQFVGFTTSSDSLYFAENNEIDIAIIDFKLPGIDGLTLTRKIKSLRPEIPVVIITGVDDFELMYEAFDAGATEFITKPFSALEFTARLRNLALLRSYQLNDLKNNHADRDPFFSVQAKLFHCTVEARISPAEPDDNLLKLAHQLALSYGYYPETAERFAAAIAYHDAGMQLIPERIVCKKTELVEIERDALRDHTLNGRDLILQAGGDFSALAAEIALTHHERFDGSGYPYGLSGELIPESGRLAAVVDVVDAMLSVRFYRSPLSFEDVMHELNSGGYDKKIAAIAVKCSEQIKKLYNC